MKSYKEFIAENKEDLLEAVEGVAHINTWQRFEVGGINAAQAKKLVDGGKDKGIRPFGNYSKSRKAQNLLIVGSKSKASKELETLMSQVGVTGRW